MNVDSTKQFGIPNFQLGLLLFLLFFLSCLEWNASDVGPLTCQDRAFLVNRRENVNSAK